MSQVERTAHPIAGHLEKVGRVSFRSDMTYAVVIMSYMLGAVFASS